MAEKKSILLRLSPRMWEEISKWAEAEFRSVNGQIEYILSDALQKKYKAAHSKSDSNPEETEQDKI